MPRQIKNSHIHYFNDVVQGSEEWKQDRVNHITGSSAHLLLGKYLPRLSKFNTNNTEFKGNFATKRGHLLEPEAIELYQKIKGVFVQHTGYVKNDKYPNCLYSPDGFLPDRTVEVKSFLPKHHLEAIENPGKYILSQCYFGQIILEKKLTDLVLYCPRPEIPVDKMLVIITIASKPAIRSNFIKRIGLVNDREK